MSTPATCHVLIYGPPAAGKLTVARALARLTDLRVVHNHLTTDLVSHLLDRDQPGFWDLVKDLRLRLFTTAAARGVGVVSTTAYVAGERPWIDTIEQAVTIAGGRIGFVQLRPSIDELERRVSRDTRREHGKLQTVDRLRSALGASDYFSLIHPEDLVVDNTDMPAADAAQLIASHFALVQ